MWVTDSKVQKFIKPQIKTLLEETLGRKVRFSYSADMGGDWNQIEVTKEEKQKVIDVWSKQSNNIKRGPVECWSGNTGDLFFKDEDGQYVVSIINPLNRENRRFAFHYRKLKKVV
jgi:hypothetical protein